jgi:hypothetical protein
MLSGFPAPHPSYKERLPAEFSGVQPGNNTGLCLFYLIKYYSPGFFKHDELIILQN